MVSRRFASTAIKIGLVGALAAYLVGCGADEDPQHDGICMENTTFLRADDDKCPDEEGNGGSGGHGWIFYPHGSTHHPAVGHRVSPGYGTVTPAGGFWKGAVPSTGGFGGTGGKVVS